MARIIYSGLVESIKGSIAGTTFQANKYGFTVKKKPKITKPATALQNQRKIIMSKVTRTWRDLTQAQRDAYDTYAETYPQYSKHNPSAQLSGYAVYVKYNCIRLLSTPQVKTSSSYTPPATDTLSYVVRNESGVLKVYVTSDTDDEEWILNLFMSRPFAVTQNFIGSKTKYISAASNTDGSVTITDEYTALYGTVPSVGDYIALDVLAIGDNAPTVLARDSQIYEVLAAA